MSDSINIRIRRVIAAVLALAFIAGALPYNPLSGVFGVTDVKADAGEGEVTEIEVYDWNDLIGNTDAAEVTTENGVMTVKLKSCVKTTNGFYLGKSYSSGAVNNYVLDLNGYGIRYSGSVNDQASLIRVNGVTFTLEDNCESPCTYYLINDSRYKISVFRTGSVTKTAQTGIKNVDYAVVTGGYITGGYSHYNSGSGLYVYGGCFYMRGGTVIGNAASVNTVVGLGLSIGFGCEFYMYGGSIRLNGIHSNPGSNVNNDGEFCVRDGLTVSNVNQDRISYFGDYAVTTSVTEGCLITAEPTFLTVDGQTYTVSGKPVRLNVTPATGYRVSSIEAEYVDPQDGTHYVPVRCRTADAEYEFTMPAADVAVSAVFEKYHTVTWNVDGVETQTYPADGAVPRYEGTPEKDADAQYTYGFVGWSDGAAVYGINEPLPAAFADATYTAVFSETVNNYTVTWKDGDEELGTDVLPYGASPEFGGAMPSRTDTAQYAYVFNGWNDGVTTYAEDNLPPVSGDVVYTADFTQSLRRYTVTLPENLVIINNVDLSDGKAFYGAVIKLKPANYMAVRGVLTVNGATVLTPDANGAYTVTVTQDTAVQGEIGRDISSYTEIIFEGCNFDTEELSYSYDGTAFTPSVTVGDYLDGWGDGYKILVPGTDYTLAYADNTGSPTEAVTATVTITGIGDYAGTAIKTFRISPFSITDSACTVEVPDQTTDGYAYIYYKFEAANYSSDAAALIDAVVKYGDRILVPGVDFTFGNVEYAGEHDEWDTMPYRIGDECRVEIKGMGDYIGMKLSNVFTIVPPAGSGTLGGFAWDFANGKLTITGSGEMPELEAYSEYPWFRFASSVTEIEIGEGVTSVAKEAFAGNGNMSYYNGVVTVTLPSSVRTIANGAFAYMTGLETVDLSSVTSIGAGAFNQCVSLDITVPATVTALEKNAFYGCVNVKFTVIWKNYDGEVLGTGVEPYSYDDAPVYGGETPFKPEDAQYVYTFCGWSPEPDLTHTNAVYTAQFTATLRKYDVTFKTQDGTTLDVIPFDYGATPVYPARVYEKLSDQYSLVIDAWTDGGNIYAFDALPPVAGEAVYSAVIVEEENRYTVTWKNWDGAVLETDGNVLYGTVPEYNGETPTKTLLWQGSTDFYHFTFTGWDGTVAPVSADVVYTARFGCTDVESYMDGETLVLKGELEIANPNNDYCAMLMPLNADQTAPVDRDDVIHIRVDASGARFPADSAQMFLGFHNVTDIDLTGADTSGVTNMNSMFWYCSSLTDLDLTGFDTGSVTDMGEMFGRCLEITELDLSSFDTGRVTSMIRMFMNCPKLETIYVSSKWTTESIENRTVSVFSNCRSLSGERGSFCTSAYSGADYACIDGTDNSRGYLTGKYRVRIAEDVCEADRYFVTGKDSSRLVNIYPKDGFMINGITVTCGETQVSATDNGSGVFSFNMPLGDVCVSVDFSRFYGDATGDGLVDTLDLTLMRQYLASPDDVTVAAGTDANADGVIDTIDLTFLRQYLADPTTVLGSLS